jgi:hypothetical protein
VWKLGSHSETRTWPELHIIVVVVVFQGLGLLACSSFRTYFSVSYESIWIVGRTPWMGDRPNAKPLPIHRTTQHRKMPTHIHASSGIRIHDPNIRAAEDRTATGTGCIALFPCIRCGYYKYGKGKVKGKVNYSLCLTKHYVMKTYWGNGRTRVYPKVSALPSGTRTANGTALCH